MRSTTFAGRKYLLLALVAVVAASTGLVYAESAEGWRRPQGAPFNVLSLCRDGIRLQVAGAEQGSTGPLNILAAAASPDGQEAIGFALPEASPEIVENGPVELLEEEPRHADFDFQFQGDVFSERYRSVPDPLKSLFPAEHEPEPDQIQEVATYAVPWDNILDPAPAQLVGAGYHVLVQLDTTELPPLTHNPPPIFQEYLGQVDDCLLFPAPKLDARLVGRASLDGHGRFFTCEGDGPIRLVELAPHDHTLGSVPGFLLTHEALSPSSECPPQINEPSRQAFYNYKLTCDPKQTVGHGSKASRFEIRFDSGERFRLTDVQGLSCFDSGDRDTSAAGFDTQTGIGTGTLNGELAHVEWKFRDGGIGQDGDLAALRVRLPLRTPRDVTPPGSSQQRLRFDLERTVFTAGISQDVLVYEFSGTQKFRTFWWLGAGQPLASGFNVALPAAEPFPPDHVLEVTICHRPPGNPSKGQTIRVGLGAVSAHLRHGDSLGPCPPKRPKLHGAYAGRQPKQYSRGLVADM